MHRARSIANGQWRGIVAAVGAAVVAIACGFPDVAFYTPDGSGDGGATTTGRGSTGDPPGSGPGQGSASSLGDAAAVGAANGDADAPDLGPTWVAIDGAGGEAGSPGGNAEGDSSSGGSGGATGDGGRARDSGGGSGSSSGAGSSGGVSCNCSANKFYPANVSCGAIAVTNLGVLCNQTSGFVGNDPGCGNSGTFVTCSADLTLLVCSATTSTVVQQCH